MKLWTLALLPLLALSACKDGKDEPEDTDTTPPEPEETADTSLPPVIESFSISYEFGWDPETMQAVGANVGGADAWPTVYIEVGESSVFSAGSGESCLIIMTTDEPLDVHPFTDDVGALIGFFFDGSALDVISDDCDGVFEPDDIADNVAAFQSFSFFGGIHPVVSDDIADLLEGGGIDPDDYLGAGLLFIDGNDPDDLDDGDYQESGRAYAFEMDETYEVDVEAQVDAEDYIVTIDDSDTSGDYPTRAYWVLQNFVYWTWQ